MTETKLIGLAAGGTGGHMFPAEALAQEMRRREWRVLLFTDERGMRYGERFPADFFAMLPAANPNTRGIAAKIAAGWAMLRASLTSIQAVRKLKPDVIVGFGGYPSAPAMFAARLLNNPHGVHEQNAVLGRVNRLVAPGADFVAHAFPDLHLLPSNCASRVVELGNPVRDAIRAIVPSPYTAPDVSAKFRLFVFGGSQGASLFSRVVPAAIKLLPEECRQRLQVVQQVRDNELATVEEAYARMGVEATVQPFFADMPDRLAEAHLVICRAGASSVTEIATVGRPAIMVPLGIAMDDHQTGNARVLVSRSAAEMIPEPDFNPEVLAQQLEHLLTDPARLSQMAVRATEAAPENAAGKLADLVEQLVESKSN